MPAVASGQFWGRNTGPAGAAVTELVASPADPDRLYAGTPGGQVLRSLDGGDHWQAIGPVVGFGDITALAAGVDAIVYAGTDRGALFRSDDGGEHWRQLVYSGSGTGDIASIAVGAGSTQFVYVLTDGGLWVSENGGASWESKQSGGLGELVADRVDPRTVIVRGAKTTDAFDTIEPLPGVRGTAVAFDTGDPNTIYSAGEVGLFRSIDAGQSAERIPIVLREDDDFTDQFLSLATDPLDAGTVYVGTELTLFKTDNHFESWVETNGGLPPTTIWKLLVHRERAGWVYAATGSGLYRSKDGGASWSALNDGVANSRVRQVAIDFSRPDAAYAATRNGVYRTDDAGRSWSRLSGGLPAAPFRVVASDPSGNPIAYAGGGEIGLFRTSDGGEHWAPVEIDEGVDDIDAIAIAPSDPNTVYVATPELARSRDGGLSWSSIAPNSARSGFSKLVVDSEDPNTLYGLSTVDDLLYRSTNGGEMWTDLNEGGLDFAIDPLDPNTIYTSDADGDFKKTTNGGRDWTVTTIASDSIPSIAIDPFTRSTIYAATDEDGVLVSHDGGATFLPINGGLVTYTSSHVVIDRRAPRLVYLSTDGNGVYVQTCGDRQVDRGEQCDDGNLVDGDACDASCQRTEPECVGDCSGDGTVTVDEILSAISIALGSTDIATCGASDGNADQLVTVDEIVSAVSAALIGCDRVGS